MVVLLGQFRNSHLVNKNNKSERITYHGNRVRIYRFWQGHKDLNCHRFCIFITFVNHLIPFLWVFRTFIPR